VIQKRVRGQPRDMSNLSTSAATHDVGEATGSCRRDSRDAHEKQGQPLPPPSSSHPFSLNPQRARTITPTEPLLARSSRLDDFDDAGLQRLDGGDVVCEDTHDARGGGDVDLDDLGR